MAWTTIAAPFAPTVCAVASATLVYRLTDSNNWESYDPIADTYTPLTAFPGGGDVISGIHDPSDDSIWLFGNAQTYRYDIAGDSWTFLTPDPNVTARTWFACGRRNRDVICAGGYDFGTPTDSVTSYDLDTDTWTVLAALPGILAECRGAWVGAAFYVFGGDDVTFTYAPTGYLYDPVGDSWSTIAGVAYDTAVAGGPAVGARSDGTLVIVGGFGTGATDATWIYDTVGDTWTPDDPAPFTGYKVGAVLTDVLYVWDTSNPQGAKFETAGPPPPFSGLAQITASLVSIDDLVTPIDPLTYTLDRSWKEAFVDVGSGQIRFRNADPALALVTLPNSLVNLSVLGVLAVTLLIEAYEAVDVAIGEEHDQTTLFRGRLHPALLDRCVIYPTNGVGRKPVEHDRAFNWTSPVYPDGTWINASVVCSVLDAQFNPPGNGLWDSGDPDSQWDPTFPDGASASVLWASDGTVASAGVGDVYLRQLVTVPNSGTHTLLVLIDNYGSVYIDGQLMITPGQAIDLPSGFRQTSRAIIEMTAGTHLIAIQATNAPGTGANPAGVGWNLYESDALGNLGTLIASSDASALIVEYAVPDGMTAGQVLGIVIDEGQTRGEIPYFTKSFDDTLDTAGNAWSLATDIATKVGATFLTFLRELSDTHIDWYVAPATTVLDAWAKGGRGNDVSGTVSYHRPTDPNDPMSGNLMRMSRTAEAASATVFLVDSAIGWSEREDGARVAAIGKLAAQLELGALGAQPEVDRVADGQLDLFSDTRVQTDIAIRPRTDAETPYVGYQGTSDTVDLEGVNHKVLGMTVTEINATGQAIFVPSLNDRVVIGPMEMFAQAIRKMIPGSLGGRSKVAQPALREYVLRGGHGTPAQTCVTITETFDQADSPTLGPDLVWTQASDGRKNNGVADTVAFGTVSNVATLGSQTLPTNPNPNPSLLTPTYAAMGQGIEATSLTDDAYLLAGMDLFVPSVPASIIAQVPILSTYTLNAYQTIIVRAAIDPGGTPSALYDEASSPGNGADGNLEGVFVTMRVLQTMNPTTGVVTTSGHLYVAAIAHKIAGGHDAIEYHDTVITAVVDGDRLEAELIGLDLTVYVNGSSVYTVTLSSVLLTGDGTFDPTTSTQAAFRLWGQGGTNDATAALNYASTAWDGVLGVDAFASTDCAP